jgi:uncharacterized OsmC-like protein
VHEHDQLSGGLPERLAALLGNATTREVSSAFQSTQVEAGQLPAISGAMHMTTTSIQINDVDTAAVGGLVNAIQADPSKAAATWRASVGWEGGFRASTVVRGFAQYPTDEPTGLGGTDSAPNPVEQVLGALGACLAIGYAANATVAGLEIKDLRIDLEGELDLHTFLGLGEGNAGYEAVRAEVHLDIDADRQTVAELHKRVVSTSPVGHTFGRAIPVSVDLA